MISGSIRPVALLLPVTLFGCFGTAQPDELQSRPAEVQQGLWEDASAGCEQLSSEDSVAGVQPVSGAPELAAVLDEAGEVLCVDSLAALQLDVQAPAPHAGLRAALMSARPEATGWFLRSGELGPSPQPMRPAQDGVQEDPEDGDSSAGSRAGPTPQPMISSSAQLDLAVSVCVGAGCLSRNSKP